jgi:hypothetical protein
MALMQAWTQTRMRRGCSLDAECCHSVVPYHPRTDPSAAAASRWFAHSRTGESRRAVWCRCGVSTLLSPAPNTKAYQGLSFEEKNDSTLPHFSPLLFLPHSPLLTALSFCYFLQIVYSYVEIQHHCCQQPKQPVRCSHFLCQRTLHCLSRRAAEGTF